MNRISTILQSIINVIGNVTMGTTATTITGAIAEHETQINSMQSAPAMYQSLFSTGAVSCASGMNTYTITVPAAPSGYSRWVFGARATSRLITVTWTLSGTQLTVNAYNSSSSSVSCYINGYVVFMNADNTIST